MINKLGKLTEKQLEVYILHKQSKNQIEIAKSLGITQPTVSNIFANLRQTVNEAKDTLDYFDILDSLDVKEMDLETTMQLVRKKHEERKIRNLSIQGTIKPFDIEGQYVVFTVGYEKRNIENFVSVLKANRIEILIDIRANGFSRKAGFSNKVLERNLASSEIDYLAIKELGSPKKLRIGMKDKGYHWFVKEYKKHLETEKSELDKLEKIVKKTRSCLMCFELDPNDCHRSIVANKLRERGFEIAHL